MGTLFTRAALAHPCDFKRKDRRFQKLSVFEYRLVKLSVIASRRLNCFLLNTLSVALPLPVSCLLALPCSIRFPNSWECRVPADKPLKGTKEALRRHLTSPPTGSGQSGQLPQHGILSARLYASEIQSLFKSRWAPGSYLSYRTRLAKS